VRRCQMALKDAAVASSKSLAEGLLKPTPRSVLMRSVLRQDPGCVKDTLAMRLTAESVFAALMLTIAFDALLDPPDVDACDSHFNSTGHCERLLGVYAASWSCTAGFFMCSSLVSLALMQVFLPVGTVHVPMPRPRTHRRWPAKK